WRRCVVYPLVVPNTDRAFTDRQPFPCSVRLASNRSDAYSQQPRPPSSERPGHIIGLFLILLALTEPSEMAANPALAATGFGAAAGRATASPAQARQADYGPWEFQSEKWELAYIQAHRRHHRGIEERRRSGHLGWSALPAWHERQCRFGLSQRTVPQRGGEGRNCLCRYLGRLCR